MGNLFVVHVHDPMPPDAKAVYIGREFDGIKLQFEESVLANPFHLRQGTSRTEIIEKYRRWLYAQVRDFSGAQYTALLEILILKRESDVYLRCWCKPKACHGDVVASAVRWVEKIQSKK